MTNDKNGNVRVYSPDIPEFSGLYNWTLILELFTLSVDHLEGCIYNGLFMRTKMILFMK